MQTPVYKRVAQYISLVGVSQRLLARNAGMTESLLSRVLKGERRLTVDELVSISKALSVKPSRFLDDDN